MAWCRNWNASGLEILHAVQSMYGVGLGFVEHHRTQLSLVMLIEPLCVRRGKREEGGRVMQRIKESGLSVTCHEYVPLRRVRRVRRVRLVDSRHCGDRGSYRHSVAEVLYLIAQARDDSSLHVP